MKELVKMWKYPNMIAMTAFTSAIYVSGLIPFKSIPLIPGFTEIRPASLLPVLFGLLFGPAGAWGSAIGNLVGDLFGTFSAASAFGFIGNFLNAYIPYKIWGRLGISYRENTNPTIDSPKKLMEFGVVTIISSTACALVIAWGCDVLKLVPFAELSSIIALNNTVMPLVLGPVFLPMLYRLFKKWNFIWTDTMSPEDMSKPVYSKLYSRLVTIGSLGGFAVGLGVSLGIARQAFYVADLAKGGAGNIIVSACILPFLAVLFYGTSRL